MIDIVDLDDESVHDEYDMVVKCTGRRRGGVLAITLQSEGMVCIVSALSDTDNDRLAQFVALVPENIAKTLEIMAEKAEAAGV